MRRLATLTAAAALAVAFGFGGAAQAATTFVVDFDGVASPGDCDTGTADSTTIQGGIDLATSGASDTVEVCPGTYTEDLDIFKDDLELAGSGSGSTTIVGIATLPAASFPLAAPNIDIQANGVSVHDFTLQHPVVLLAEYSSGIVLDGTDIEISDNAFLVGAGDISQAIQSWASSPVGLADDISGLNIHNNTFSHLAPLPVGGHGYEGIFINPQINPEDSTNPISISNNTFSGELIRAITVDSRSFAVIHGNTISTIHGVEFTVLPRGIQLGRSGGTLANNMHVLKNSITAVTASGGVFVTAILVTSKATNVKVVFNAVVDAETGVEVAGDKNQIVNNSIATVGTSGVAGVALVAAFKNHVVNNRITCGNGDGVTIDGSSTRNNVIANRFSTCGATISDAISNTGGGTNKIKANKIVTP